MAFEISGNDWLGIGATGSAAYQGTDECGSRPNCIALGSLNKECIKRRDEFEACRAKANASRTELASRQLALQEQELKLQQRNTSGKNYMSYLLIAGAVIAVWYFFIKKKK